MRITKKTIADLARKFPYVAGEHAFLFVLALLALGGVFVGLVFYVYVFSVSRAEITRAPETELNQQLFGTVRSELQRRAQAFGEAGATRSPDIFQVRLTK